MRILSFKFHGLGFAGFVWAAIAASFVGAPTSAEDGSGPQELKGLSSAIRFGMIDVAERHATFKAATLDRGFPREMEVPKNLLTLSVATGFRIQSPVIFHFDCDNRCQSLWWSARITGLGEESEALPRLSKALTAFQIKPSRTMPFCSIIRDRCRQRVVDADRCEPNVNHELHSVLFSRCVDGNYEEVYVDGIEPVFDGNEEVPQFTGGIIWAISSHSDAIVPRVGELRTICPFFFRTNGAQSLAKSLVTSTVQSADSQLLGVEDGKPRSQIVHFVMPRAESAVLRKVFADSGYKFVQQRVRRSATGEVVGTSEDWTSRTPTCSISLGLPSRIEEALSVTLTIELN